ncbi:MarR family winged helix-turn-helix transcriptional regulator [Pseudodesulfovibrio tunisiensis]|uniref:MarR family winged helix-turn-helix transcriptional regulator n=1 Tax=Pseudodesulfovibrio tunisiensis TaxID=463192 RepID=UPI001FB261E5|nr:MarR family transcriptional regulator [Pseudodesulfovibrio tunisiensis]
MTKSERFATGESLHALFKRVFALHAALTEVQDSVHEQAGMRTSQIKMADRLQRFGPATVPDLAAALGVSRQYVQTVCNELHDAALLTFEDNPRHKRSKLMALTDSGCRVLAEARAREAGIIRELLPDLDDAAVSEATELLAEIVKRIRHV